MIKRVAIEVENQTMPNGFIRLIAFLPSSDEHKSLWEIVKILIGNSINHLENRSLSKHSNGKFLLTFGDFCFQ